MILICWFFSSSEMGSIRPEIRLKSVQFRTIGDASEQGMRGAKVWFDLYLDGTQGVRDRQVLAARMQLV
jgi:hypothetical protein